MNKDTVAYVTLEYNHKEYKITENFGENYSSESARFMFEDGNYGCDCNLSQFIKSQCDDNFPLLECGHTINIKNIRVDL